MPAVTEVQVKPKKKALAEKIAEKEVTFCVYLTVKAGNQANVSCDS